MPRSRFITEKTRDAGNDGGETRLKMRTSTGLYQTIAHFTDAGMARQIAKLLNRRTQPPVPQADSDHGQRELLPVDHRSVTQRRLKYNGVNGDWINPEAFYHAAWRRENDSKRTSRPLLQGILVPDDDRKKGWEAVAVSRRDAMVAATVIQWLGTNVGRGFVLGVEREIEEATKRQEQVRAVRRRLRPEPPPQAGQGGKKAKRTLEAARERLRDATKGAK